MECNGKEGIRGQHGTWTTGHTDSGGINQIAPTDTPLRQYLDGSGIRAIGAQCVCSGALVCKQEGIINGICARREVIEMESEPSFPAEMRELYKIGPIS
ncbi:hypothetical protein EGR_08715 [Echinococcus granulosus]|uniref:Uncharacterized protein n=1 Tax=Echinococcus granulosus TaxID=6210 RepID=W6U5S2_ECHGR|nr:hypothetical protein EGR_08715 [Echinococcus granulosus]EUB56450.1 hypothetical protein EGR_08715 [Echinococcus granulosus]